MVCALSKKANQSGNYQLYVQYKKGNNRILHQVSWVENKESKAAFTGYRNQAICVRTPC